MHGSVFAFILARTVMSQLNDLQHIQIVAAGFVLIGYCGR